MNDDGSSGTKIKEKILNLFIKHFNFNHVEPKDSFDQSVFFLKNDQDYYKNLTNIRYFSDLINSTPNEGDDIIKVIIIQSLIKSKQKKVVVQVFLEELVDSLMKLKEERKRVDILIKKYDAFRTKNVIEEHLNSFDTSVITSDTMKSCMKIFVSKIEGLTKGEYKLSLLAATFNNKSNKEEVAVETFDYKLNHIIHCKDDKPLLLNDKGNEYFFPEFEIYSYEMTAEDKASSISNFDSGTNLLYFSLRIENLNKNYEDIVETEKKPILELLLSNLKPLIDNYSLNKSFYTDCGVGQDNSKSIVLKLNVVFDFDPVTLATVFNKIVVLLKNIISFKVLVDHKWKTIIKYFPDLEADIKQILEIDHNSSKNEENRDNKCIIF